MNKRQMIEFLIVLIIFISLIAFVMWWIYPFVFSDY